MPNVIQRWGATTPLTRAELIAGAWELFSALLFASAVFPLAFTSLLPAAIFAAGLLLSIRMARVITTRGRIGPTLAAAPRIPLWLVPVAPMLPRGDARVLLASLCFGLMAFGLRRAVYRRVVFPPSPDASPDDLRRELRPRLAENAALAGIVGGHVMLLFSVAFLRTRSVVVFHAWWEIIPALALLGTVGFTLAIRPLTREVLGALAAGADGDRAILRAGLHQAEYAPQRLAALNFVLWLGCIGLGVARLQSRPGPHWVSAVVPLAFGSLFAFGVSFYQRGWHEDAMRVVAARLRAWTGERSNEGRLSLRRRMLSAFGVPLVFTLTLSLFASIGMYRTMETKPSFEEDFAAITALSASFAMLVIATLGLFFRAARELSDPLARIASAADEVARGRLGDEVPAPAGPREVQVLAKSIEDMRRALAQTIASLEEERASLEVHVERRTAELRRALEELKQAQTALVHGERMALLGQLVAGVAHEIHNPLSAVAGSISSLERVRDELAEMLGAYRESEAFLGPEERARLVRLREKLDVAGSLDDLAGVAKVVQSATRRSVEIVSVLRSFARATAEPLPADLHAGLGETLSLLDHRLRHLGIRVERRHGDILPVVCRAGEINQVFMNLLSNAADAVAERNEPSGDGPKGERGAGRIVVSTERDGEDVLVTVSDDGPGVPPELAELVFEPFFTTKPSGQGTGLGLSISRDIVRRHGGKLTLARDEELGGARFVCRLPLHPKDDRPRASRAPRRDRGAGKSV